MSEGVWELSKNIGEREEERETEIGVGGIRRGRQRRRGRKDRMRGKIEIYAVIFLREMGEER